MDRVRSGESSAFAEIVDRYTQPLYALAYRMTGSAEEAEEAVQEIFIRAYRRLSTFDRERRFFTWLYTIAVNHLRSLGRSAKERRRKEAFAVEDGLEEVLPSRQEYAPERQAMQHEAGRLIDRALRELKREYRLVFVLRHIEGLSIAEVSRILNVPENTVKTHERRARLQLRDLLFSYGWE